MQHVESQAHPIFLSPEAELRRLDRHFRRVLRRLRRSAPPGLDRAQRRARGRHIEVLDRYRRAQRFPQNRAFPGLMVPIFVDPAGTHCAMGHLIAQSGGADLVQHVAATRNYARIAQMADLAELGEWLDRNGLTAAEAALIQPSYCDTPASCVCYTKATTILEGDLAAGGTVTITEVHGDAQGLMAGDSVTLTQMGQVMVGEHVLVNYHPPSDPAAVQVEMVVPPSGELVINQCSFSGAQPGNLATDVWIEAVLAGSKSACFDVLEKEDPSWVVATGSGCGMSSSSSSGGTTGTTSGTDSGSGGTGGAGGQGTFENDVVVTSRGCGVQTGDAPGNAMAWVLLAGILTVHRLRRRRAR